MIGETFENIQVREIGKVVGRWGGGSVRQQGGRTAGARKVGETQMNKFPIELP